MLKGVRNVNFRAHAGVEVSAEATFMNFTAFHTPMSLLWPGGMHGTCNRRTKGSTIPGGVARIDTDFPAGRNGMFELLRKGRKKNLGGGHMCNGKAQQRGWRLPVLERLTEVE